MLLPFVLNLIVPFVMILVAHLLKRNSVPEMNAHRGYDTLVSRKSAEHWRQGQIIAPKVFLRLGKILLVTELILSAILTAAKLSVLMSVYTGTAVGFGFLIFAFWRTDSEIEKCVSGAVKRPLQ